MVDRVILHVGPNKTGTTALQHAFVANTGLLARHHISYPMTGRVVSAHHGIANACRSNDGQILSDLADETCWESTVLLSSELFAGLEPHEMERLRRVFGKASVEVVYTLRRLPDLWPSHWKEMVKHGQHLSFPEYMVRPANFDRSAFRAPPMPSYQLNALAQVFGHESLRLAVYDARLASDRDNGVGFARDILRLGVHADSFGTAKRNRTPPDWQIEVLRHLNQRANGFLDAAGKRQLASDALSLLNADPPEWAAPFKALLAGGEATKLTSDSPAVASEQAAVLGAYRDRLIDPVETYIEKSESKVRTLDESCLGADLKAELDAVFGVLMPQSKDA